MRFEWAAAALIAIAGTRHLEAQNVFSTTTTLVRVDVAVTLNGRPVDGLRAADFEVRDNGVPQEISIVHAADVPLSVYLVLDASASVSGEKITHLTQAADAFLSALTHDDRATLITFSHNVELVTALEATPDAARRAMARVKPSGATALYDALSAALLLPGIPGRRTIAIVFSDGKDTLSWTSEPSLLDLARRTQMVVYAIALDDPASRAVASRIEARHLVILRRLAEATGGQMGHADSLAELRPLFADALRDIRGRYVLAYHPEGVAGEGWHTIHVGLRGRRGVIRSRPGYIAGQ
jgi:VWFA-related protein